MFSGERKWILGGLSVLLIAALIAFVATRPSAPQSTATNASSPLRPQIKLVDQQPLQTANALASIASTAKEQQIAEQAVRLADQEVDLAFATALRQAQDAPPPQGGELKQARDRIAALQSRLTSLQQQATRLSKTASTNNDDAQKLEMVQARVSLLQDTIEDAKQDLLRAGGDPEGEVKQELEEHEALQHGKPSITTPRASSLAIENNLLSQFREWRRLRENRNRLLEAQQDAHTAIRTLAAKHEALEKGLPDALNAIGDDSAGDALQQTTALATLHNLSDKNKTLAAYDKRIEAQQQLAMLYGQWAEIVGAQILTALHAILRSLLWILLAWIGIVVAEGVVEHFYMSLGPDRRRMGRMRLVLRFVAEVIGVLVILLVLFGPPTQLSTVLALAGAGLTVALKDFIVAFCGWFVLMGKHGIRHGDWVEINGIGGEVVEVGLLRTILLETGDWEDAGHPTGRKVSFVNSFAIEGHYFNFTTAGQWLWDELDILIPAGEDPYELTNSVLRLVAEQTREEAARAEQEWRSVARDTAVQDFSAAPAINVRPSNLGVNLVVRYIATAHNRYAVRTKLYQAIVELLHQRKPDEAAEPAPSQG